MAILASLSAYFLYICVYILEYFAPSQQSDFQ